MKVAIADDDPIVASSLETILTATGTAEVPWKAASGVEAVERYRQERPDVLLIDVQMPGMDGLEASRRILNEDAGARILVLTTFCDPGYIGQAVRIGTKGYLIKQDVASVVPAVQAVMAGQVVLGAQAMDAMVGGGPARQVQGGAGVEQGAPAFREGSRFASLTPRERDVAALVADGYENRAIAAALGLSEGSVRNKVSAILAKTNLRSRTQLALEWNAREGS